MNEARLYFKVTNAKLIAGIGLILICIAVATVATAQPGLRWVAVVPYLFAILCLIEAEARFKGGRCRSLRERVWGEYKTPPLNDYKGLYTGENE